jgi:hypothetical protein
VRILPGYPRGSVKNGNVKWKIRLLAFSQCRHASQQILDKRVNAVGKLIFPMNCANTDPSSSVTSADFHFLPRHWPIQFTHALHNRDYSLVEKQW